MSILPTLILMLGVIGMMSFLAPRIATPAPVLFAVAGVIWSLIPSLPGLAISPAVVLAIFLPPPALRGCVGGVLDRLPALAAADPAARHW